MEVIKETLWKRRLSTPTKPPAKNSNFCLSDDSVPAQRNEEEVQENNSSRHNSVTAALSNVQTTSYRKPWPKSKKSVISKQRPSPLHHTFLLGRARFTSQPLSALLFTYLKPRPSKLGHIFGHASRVNGRKKWRLSKLTTHQDYRILLCSTEQKNFSWSHRNYCEFGS